MQSRNKTTKGLKILLLQIRENDQVRQEEHQSFADYAGVNKSQIEILNVFDRPLFPKEVIQGFDALFIGGASEASVLEPERFPFIDPCLELIKEVIERKVPTFASCFGFQLTVLALGGEITRDLENYEMGTLPIQLAEGASKDSLFKDISNNFFAVSVHQEKATKLPDDSELMAFTDNCLHSFKVVSAPFWAFQFHPELDKNRLIQRLNIYKEKYTEDLSHYNQIIEGLQETPESNQLVRNFINYLLLN